MGRRTLFQGVEHELVSLVRPTETQTARTVFLHPPHRRTEFVLPTSHPLCRQSRRVLVGPVWGALWAQGPAPV